MAGKVDRLQVAPAPGAPMTSITEAHLIPGKGIVGDRFFNAHKPSTIPTEVSYEVTLIAVEDVIAFNAAYPEMRTEEYGRRNIVVSGCHLQPLASRTFHIGEVLLQGFALPAADCHSPQGSQRSICTDLRQSMLGAQILTEGTIHVGDPIY